jgi:hypothetical protein
MCYLRLTRYTCSHLSPIHPPSYIPPKLEGEADSKTRAYLKMQSDINTEWPTHPDSSCVGCQDAGRRGARCSGPLEDLKDPELDPERRKLIVEEGKDVCEDCREWVDVGGAGEKDGEKEKSREDDKGC